MKVDELLQGARDAMSVRRVYGEPVEAEGVTVVPAAIVVGGGGGGGDADDNGGGGFGLMARPVGAWVISDGVVSWRSQFVGSPVRLAFVERAELLEEEKAFDAWLGRREERP